MMEVMIRGRLWRSAPSHKGSISGNDSMLSLGSLFLTDV